MWTHPCWPESVFEIAGYGPRWYGLMYVLGFLGCYALTRAAGKYHGLSKDVIDDGIFYSVLGVVVGGRLGYVLFYGLEKWDVWYYPFQIWEGGMSFHGGLIGTMLALIWLAKKYQIRWFVLADVVCMAAPIGLLAGRLGNFINAELWGRATDPTKPWAMLFPQSPEQYAMCKADGNSAAFLLDLYDKQIIQPRHPSMVYEAVLEGVVLLIIMQIFLRFRPPLITCSALFVFFYGIFRTSVEFVRQPDSHMGNGGFLLGTDWLTMGIVLSMSMVLVGAVALVIGFKRNEPLLQG